MNLTAPMWLCRARDPAHDRRPGTARSSTSRAARRSGRRPGSSAYAASKSGLNGLTRAIAVDYASAGIRCNTISPGYVLNDRRDADIDPEAPRSAARRSTSPGSASPTTSRYAAVYLASRESEFVTGINLPLDGGSSAARGAVLG